MAGKPEAVSLEQEIVSKKGKIPSREMNETHLKVTRPKGSKVTEKMSESKKASTTSRIRRVHAPAKEQTVQMAPKLYLS